MRLNKLESFILRDQGKACESGRGDVFCCGLVSTVTFSLFCFGGLQRFKLENQSPLQLTNIFLIPNFGDDHIWLYD